MKLEQSIMDAIEGAVDAVCKNCDVSKDVLRTHYTSEASNHRMMGKSEEWVIFYFNQIRKYNQ
jgi:hypothetical protein